MYDPSKALASAVVAWLPKFSLTENCTTEIPLITRGDNSLESMDIEVRSGVRKGEIDASSTAHR